MTQKIIITTGLIWSFITMIYILGHYYRLAWNCSTSLPQKLWVLTQNKSIKVHDYIMFKFHDFRMKNSSDYELVIKQVGGVAGDRVKIQYGYIANNIKPYQTNLNYILPDGTYQVYNIISNNHFNPLTTKNITIPNGCYFVHGLNHPSFDSRYKEFGLICESQIYGKAYSIF